MIRKWLGLFFLVSISVPTLLYAGQGFSVVGWNDSTHLGMARGGPS